MVRALVVVGVAALAAAVSLSTGLVVAAIGPASAAAPDAVQFLSYIDGAPGKTFTVTAPATGTYVVRYDVEDVAEISSFVDARWIGTLGLTSGLHDSASFTLTTGTHTIGASEPEGYLGASVHLAQID